VLAVLPPSWRLLVLVVEVPLLLVSRPLLLELLPLPLPQSLLL
jgi:hypothetical protein